MPMETVDRLFERAIEHCGHERSISFVWHGGEPMLMGADFYRTIGEKTKAWPGYSIRHLMQTNFTLLTDEMLEVIKEYGFRLSTSIDGPRHVHDATRVDRAGRGTFDRVLRTVEFLKKNGITVGAIAVLSNATKEYADDIYDFFRSQKMNFRVNSMDIQGRARDYTDSLTLDPGDYADCMIKIFDRWFYDSDSGIVVDPFDTIINNILTGNIAGCDYKRNCHHDIVSVGPDGSVYPCGKFSGNHDLVMGNIHQQSFGECLASDAIHPFLHRVPEAIPECSTCEYQEICNGGCPVGPYNERDSIMTPDVQCHGRKRIFEHILSALEKDVERAANLAKSSLDANERSALAIL
jgi:uncharacterized protein